jgi:hypothetical protein
MADDRKVSHGSDNDVNRALAACGAAPMQYRNFEDSIRPTPDTSPTAPNTCEFPLLLEALPEVGQIPVAAVTSGQPIVSVLEDPPPAPADSDRMDLSRPPVRPSARGFQTDVAPEKPIAIPLGDAQTSRRTLSRVFQTLSAANPLREKRPTAGNGLQGILSRL